MEEPTVANSNVRRIIYVDASYNHETKESKISLYDKEINKLDTLILTRPNNSGEAEKFSILYACLYTKKKGLDGQKIHILNDNFGATTDRKILEICKYFGVNVSWIPREINIIADNGTKLEANIKIEDSNILEVFYDLLIDESFSVDGVEKVDKIDNISTRKKNILKNAIRHTKVENKPYVSIGQVGKYLKANNPTYEYSSLKKELEKYEDDFVIVDNNYVKIK